MRRSEALALLDTVPVARLATVRPDGTPHLVPVTFARIGDRIVHMVDHKPKATTALQRLANLDHDPRASLLADHYEEDWDMLWWVRVDGRATVSRDGGEWKAVRRALQERHPQYRAHPPEGPAVILEIERVSGWSAAG